MNKLLLVAAVFACGCTPGSNGPQLASANYGVCVNLPEGSTHSKLQKHADFETASVTIDGLDVEVMIGGHPPFSRSAIKDVLQATDGFELLGEETSDGADKMLFGYNRSNDPVDGFYGPENELVMLSAADLKPVRNLLVKNGVVVDCRKNFVTPSAS